MTGYDVFEQYIAIRNHFKNKTYDYFKYKGKIKSATKESYLKRRDYDKFEAFAKEHKSIDMPGLLVSQFVENIDFWIGVFDNKVFLDWKGRKNSLFYNFQSDLRTILKAVTDKQSFQRLFIHPKKQHPHILQLLLNRDIKPETFAIINQYYPFFDTLDKNISNHLVWEKKRTILKKYIRFIEHDEKKFKEYLTEQIKEFI